MRYASPFLKGVMTLPTTQLKASATRKRELEAKPPIGGLDKVIKKLVNKTLKAHKL